MTNSQVQMEAVFCMPSKNTYTIKPIKELLQEEITGFSIDPFARKSRMAEHTAPSRRVYPPAHPEEGRIGCPRSERGPRGGFQDGA